MNCEMKFNICLWHKSATNGPGERKKKKKSRRRRKNGDSRSLMVHINFCRVAPATVDHIYIDRCQLQGETNSRSSSLPPTAAVAAPTTTGSRPILTLVVLTLERSVHQMVMSECREKQLTHAGRRDVLCNQ